VKKYTGAALMILMLSFLTGCADFKSYMKDRGNDFADCFTARAGLCYGLGIRGQVTNYVSAAVGGSYDSDKIGFWGRKPVRLKGVWVGLPAVSVAMMYAIIEDQLIENVDQFYFACALSTLGAAFTDMRDYPGQHPPPSVSVLGINFLSIATPDEWEQVNKRPSTPFLREMFFIEAGATLGVVGFDFGFNPVEFFDFLLGWTTLDITGDDAEMPSGHSTPTPPQDGK